MIEIGRWRVEGRLEVWRARRRPHVVLWGAREGDVAFGSHRDRVREMEAAIMRDVLASMQRELLRGVLGLERPRTWGGCMVVPFDGLPKDAAIVVQSGSVTSEEELVFGPAHPVLPKYVWIGDIDSDVQPLAKLSRQGAETQAMPERERSDAEKLAAYTDARGWLPGEDAA